MSGWLGLPIDTFLSSYLRRRPWASPGTADSARALMDWEALDRVLAAAPAPDVLVVARGRLLDIAAPRSLAELRALMRSGVGIVVRYAERQDPDLAALAAAVAHELPGEAHVQLFATPRGTHGFGWHYDLEDVLVAQTAGAKDYYFRENTVDLPPISRTPRLEFSAFSRERSPIATARLIPGDSLYIPARWWHHAQCLEDALSISIGFIPDNQISSWT